MELEHSFTVPVPEERAWEVLLDVEKVAPCMPGATLDSVDGDVISGRIKVKVGPIAMTYAGTARFTERDPEAHVITLEASGKETRGAGTASAKVRSMLEGQDGQTHVVVHTTLNVTGRPAQFGRGVMAEVGGKLIGVFASNLADMLAAEPAQPSDGKSGDTVQGDGEAGGELAKPIEGLNLSLRSYNSLSREGIHTVGDLAAKTREELLAIDHIGPASVEEIRQKLADQGLTLADSPASGNGLPASPPAAAAPASHPPTVPSRITTAPSAGTAAGDSAAASYDSAGSSDDDAIDLLSVAGLPVLKRAAPVAAAVAAVAVIVFRLRRRRSRR
jgi:carbon monoxide dehydrogenase subunit G/predicted flap endonuclease-1-like 5' DNA nuclease